MFMHPLMSLKAEVLKTGWSFGIPNWSKCASPNLHFQVFTAALLTAVECD